MYAGGLIYLQDEDGTATVLKASTKHEVVTTSAIGERTLASYGVTGKSLLLRSDKNLYRIEAR